MSVFLVSTYDLGRQPFGLASPAAFLRRAGIDAVPRDLSREPLTAADLTRATRVAFYLPMHTATRLAMPVIERIRAERPDLPMCAYGLYAPLNEDLLRAQGVSAIFGPEAEEQLVNWSTSPHRDITSPHRDITSPHRDITSPHREIATSHRDITTSPNLHIARLSFLVPDRSGLPPLARYATVRMPDGRERVAGATDATRGCKHRCRHCPIVPVYDGQFRVVPVDVVMADVDQQVAAGAEHITFGDPDFLNGPTHARRIVDALHARHPRVSYDVTIKIEHVLRHRDLLPVLASTGCLFVTSAVESVDDRVLARFAKNHTRADFVEAVRLTREAGVTLVPTFVAFTPWTTLDGYRDLLDTVERLELVDHVAPVQWGLRLLVTRGSRLLELDDIARIVQPFDPRTLTYPWVHTNRRVDALQQAIARLVGVRAGRSRRELFDEIGGLADRAPAAPQVSRAAIPFLNEPWYC